MTRRLDVTKRIFDVRIFSSMKNCGRARVRQFRLWESQRRLSNVVPIAFAHVPETQTTIDHGVSVGLRQLLLLVAVEETMCSLVLLIYFLLIEREVSGGRTDVSGGIIGLDCCRCVLAQNRK